MAATQHAFTMRCLWAISVLSNLEITWKQVRNIIILEEVIDLYMKSFRTNKSNRPFWRPSRRKSFLSIFKRILSALSSKKMKITFHIYPGAIYRKKERKIDVWTSGRQIWILLVSSAFALIRFQMCSKSFVLITCNAVICFFLSRTVYIR